MATYVWNGSTSGVTTLAGNWTPSGPPGDGDTVVFPAWADGYAVVGNATFPAGAGVGVGFAEVIIEDGVTYNIGSRTTPLVFYMDDGSATNKITIGGTGTFFLTPKEYNLITVTSAGAAPATGEYALNLTAMLMGATRTGAVHVLCEDNQSVGIAAEGGALSELESLVIHGGEVVVGSGVTDNDAASAVPTMTVYGGTVETNMPVLIGAQFGGVWTHMDGAMGTSTTINSGTMYYRSDGTAAVVIIGDGGVVDCSQDLSGRTFSKCDLFAGASLLDPYNTITLTAGADLNSCGIEDVTLDLGSNFRITRGSVAA